MTEALPTPTAVLAAIREGVCRHTPRNRGGQAVIKHFHGETHDTETCMCAYCHSDRIQEMSTTATDLTEAWTKFRHGDALTDKELIALLVDIETGIPFLENRGETGGVLFKARLDRETLQGYQRARKGNGR